MQLPRDARRNSAFMLQPQRRDPGATRGAWTLKTGAKGCATRAYLLPTAVGRGHANRGRPTGGTLSVPLGSAADSETRGLSGLPPKAAVRAGAAGWTVGRGEQRAVMGHLDDDVEVRRVLEVIQTHLRGGGGGGGGSAVTQPPTHCAPGDPAARPVPPSRHSRGSGRRSRMRADRGGWKCPLRPSITMMNRVGPCESPAGIRREGDCGGVPLGRAAARTVPGMYSVPSMPRE